MSVQTFKYNNRKQLTKNINASELKCKCGSGHDTKIDITHVNNIQKFMDKNGYDKVIFSSGYRCPKHDKAVGGSGVGQHVNGRATDACFYKKGKLVSSKEVCCKAQDFGFRGIAYIDVAYVHLDNRTSGQYRGDETRGYSNNVGGDFYRYYGIPRTTTSAAKPNVIYQSYDNKHNCWLGIISNYNEKNEDGYAGILGSPMGGLRVKLSDGSVIRVKSHVMNGEWLSEVTKWDNTSNGYSGIKGNPIDGIMIKSDTHKIKYRVYADGRWYAWVDGYSTKDPINGYAGVFGKAISAIQIQVVD